MSSKQQILNDIASYAKSTNEDVTEPTDEGNGLIGGRIFNQLSCYTDVDSMKSDRSLTNGNVAKTLGYYSAKDGGGATYLIRKKDQNDIDDPTTIILKNNMVAEFIVENERINIMQLGYTRDNFNQDCHDSVAVYIKLCERDQHKYEFFIPAGRWFFSETDISNGRKGVWVTGVNENLGSDDGCGETILLPFNENQEYIWNLGESRTSKALVSTNTLRNLTFSTGWHGYKDYYRNFCKVGLMLTYCCYSYFDGIYFHYFRGCGLCIQTGYENYFGYLNFRGSGFVDKEFTYPSIWLKPNPTYTPASAISATYWDYIDFEGIDGPCIYSEPGSIVVHDEINNIQVEWSMAYNYATDITVTENTKNTPDTPPVAWDDASDDVEHWYVIKGQTSGNCAICINTISVSCAGQWSKTVTWYDKDKVKHTRRIRQSGLIGDLDRKVVKETIAKTGKPYMGTNIIVSKVSLLGDDNFPVYHCADHSNITNTAVKVCQLTDAIVNPFMVKNANGRDIFEANNFKKHVSSDDVPIDQFHRFYLGSITNSLINLCSMNDGSGINNLVVRGVSSFICNMDGTKDTIIRVYLEYKSIDDVPAKIDLPCNRFFADGKQVNSWLKITKDSIIDGTYPINQWFNYNISNCAPEYLPATTVLTQISIPLNNIYVDYIEPTSKIRKVPYSALISDNMTNFSDIGAILYCVDRKEADSEKCGTLVMFDGTRWFSLRGTAADKLTACTVI